MARQSYLYTWAQTGTAVDPETDTTDPSYVPNMYGRGWIAQKPPNQWQNYLSAGTDLKIKEIMLKNGWTIWEAGVRYQPGAVVRSGNILYQNVSGTVLVDVTPVEGPQWRGVLDTRQTDLQAKVNGWNTQYAQHLAASNPHLDSIAKAGGMSKGSFLTPLSDPNDTRTIVYHTRLTGAVHSETPAQAGTLPTSGGIFTGTVTFLAPLRLRTDVSNAVGVSDATGMVDMNFVGIGLDINSNGQGYVRRGSVLDQIVSEARYDELNRLVSPRYALPEPYYRFTFAGSLSDMTAIGNWYLESATDVSVTYDGADYKNNTILCVPAIGFSTNTAITTYFVGVNAAGAVVRRTFDTNMAMIGGFSNFLTAVEASGAVRVKQLYIFTRLTPEQKLSLVA